MEDYPHIAAAVFVTAAILLAYMLGHLHGERAAEERAP